LAEASEENFTFLSNCTNLRIERARLFETSVNFYLLHYCTSHKKIFTVTDIAIFAQSVIPIRYQCQRPHSVQLYYEGWKII